MDIIEKQPDELYPHQKDDVTRFKDEREIALFCEQGTGKSARFTQYYPKQKFRFGVRS